MKLENQLTSMKKTPADRANMIAGRLPGQLVFWRLNDVPAFHCHPHTLINLRGTTAGSIIKIGAPDMCAPHLLQNNGKKAVVAEISAGHQYHFQ